VLQGYLLLYRVILIGNRKVGKTSLLNYVLGKSANQHLTPTIGVEYAPVTIRVGSNDVRINIWDTCTQHATQPGPSSTSPSRGPTTASATA
jgi:small GTP-binding protein